MGKGSKIAKKKTKGRKRSNHPSSKVEINNQGDRCHHDDDDESSPHRDGSRRGDSGIVGDPSKRADPFVSRTGGGVGQQRTNNFETNRASRDAQRGADAYDRGEYRRAADLYWKASRRLEKLLFAQHGDDPANANEAVLSGTKPSDDGRDDAVQQEQQHSVVDPATAIEEYHESAARHVRSSSSSTRCPTNATSDDKIRLPLVEMQCRYFYNYMIILKQQRFQMDPCPFVTRDDVRVLERYATEIDHDEDYGCDSSVGGTVAAAAATVTGMALIRSGAAYQLGVLYLDLYKKLDRAASYFRLTVSICDAASRIERDTVLCLTAGGQPQPVRYFLDHNRRLARDELYKLEHPVLFRHVAVPQEEGDDDPSLDRYKRRMEVGGGSCDACGKTLQQLGVSCLSCCKRCGNAYYCSVDCQRRQWKKGHKTKCRKPNQIEIGDYMMVHDVPQIPHPNGTSPPKQITFKVNGRVLSDTEYKQSGFRFELLCRVVDVIGGVGDNHTTRDIRGEAPSQAADNMTAAAIRSDRGSPTETAPIQGGSGDATAATDAATAKATTTMTAATTTASDPLRPRIVTKDRTTHYKIEVPLHSGQHVLATSRQLRHIRPEV